MIRGAEICPRITITKITISEKEMHLQKEQECGEMSRKTKKCGYRKRILAGVLSAVVALSSVQMPVTALHAAAWDQNKFSDSLKLRFWNNEKPGVRFYINALELFRFEDDGETYGKLLEGGKIGFRQLAPMIGEYENIFWKTSRSSQKKQETATRP